MNRHFIKAGHRKKNTMNKTEARYALVLKDQKEFGDIHDYFFESFKLRIGDNCWYTPDFMVIGTQDEIEFHEIKGGFYTDDAMVKFKAVCTLYPRFKFKMVQWKNKQWTVIREN